MKNHLLRFISLTMVLCMALSATVFASDGQSSEAVEAETGQATIESASEEEIQEFFEVEETEDQNEEIVEVQAEKTPYDPLNNDSFTAIEMSFDTTYTGSITDSNTVCWYKITLPSSGRITITANAAIQWIYYKLLDSDKNQIGSWNPSWDSSIHESTAKYTYDFTKGYYYFVVSKDGSYTGNYSVKVSFTAAEETYPESGNGNDNTYDVAHAIKFNTVYKGQMAYNDSVDWYKITLASSGSLNITANAGMSWIYYKLLDDSRNQVGSWNPNWNSSVGESSFNQTLDITKGTYYFVVSKDGSSTGQYSFKMSFKSAGESFAETAGGTNNSYDKASNITKGVEYKGQIAVNDTVDWYTFKLTQPANVVVTANNNMGYIYYNIYNSDRTQIKRWNPNSNNLVDSVQLEEGTYYFVVSKDGNTGNYSFRIAAEYFTDVPANHSFNAAVTWAVDEGIAAGYTGSKKGLFGVGDNITRGQVAMFLWRAAGKPTPKSMKQTFKDVPVSHNFFMAIQWAAEQGIAGGYSGSKKGYFGPSDNCTRGQIATFLWRFAGSPDPKSNKQTFSDVPVKHNFYKAIQWAVENKITGGYTGAREGQFGPSDLCTRGQCVTFLYRLLKK